MFYDRWPLYVSGGQGKPRSLWPTYQLMRYDTKNMYGLEVRFQLFLDIWSYPVTFIIISLISNRMI